MAATAAATAAPVTLAPAVDWCQVVAALQGSDEWAQLLGDLAGIPGGPSVAALLRLAVARAAAAGPGSAGGAAGGGRERLAEVVQQVAWEKLHTGDWHVVAVAWRDAYAAACVLAAAAGLPARQEGQQAAPAAPPADADAASNARPGSGPHAEQQGEAAALAAALWHLDMAAIMGGPLLRPLVDALIEELQQRWQALHGGAAAAAAAAGTAEMKEQGWAEQPAGSEAGGEQAGEQPAAKRARTAGGEAAPPDGAAPAIAAAAPGGNTAGAAPAGTAAAAGTAEPAAAARTAGKAAAAAAAETARTEATAGTAGAAAPAGTAAAEAALLPPWSLGPRGSPVAAAELPSLEAFWRDYMSQGTPVVISGALGCGLGGGDQDGGFQETSLVISGALGCGGQSWSWSKDYCRGWSRLGWGLLRRAAAELHGWGAWARQTGACCCCAAGVAWRAQGAKAMTAGSRWSRDAGAYGPCHWRPLVPCSIACPHLSAPVSSRAPSLNAPSGRVPFPVLQAPWRTGRRSPSGPTPLTSSGWRGPALCL